MIKNTLQHLYFSNKKFTGLNLLGVRFLHYYDDRDNSIGSVIIPSKKVIGSAETPENSIKDTDKVFNKSVILEPVLGKMKYVFLNRSISTDNIHYMRQKIEYYMCKGESALCWISINHTRVVGDFDLVYEWKMGKRQFPFIFNNDSSFEELWEIIQDQKADITSEYDIEPIHVLVIQLSFKITSQAIKPELLTKNNKQLLIKQKINYSIRLLRIPISINEKYLGSPMTFEHNDDGIVISMNEFYIDDPIIKFNSKMKQMNIPFRFTCSWRFYRITANNIFCINVLDKQKIQKILIDLNGYILAHALDTATDDGGLIRTSNNVSYHFKNNVLLYTSTHIIN